MDEWNQFGTDQNKTTEPEPDSVKQENTASEAGWNSESTESGSSQPNQGNYGNYGQTTWQGGYGQQGQENYNQANHIGISKRGVASIFQINLDDMVVGNSSFFKVIVE